MRGLRVRMAARMAALLVVAVGLDCLHTAASEKVMVRCCDLWDAMSQFVAVSTGETIYCPASSCKSTPHILKIIKNMVPALTDETGTDMYSFEHSDMFASNAVANVLAFSILGRVCADDRSTSGDGRDFLQFNTDTQTLRVRRRGCEYEKTMYSTLLFLCIAVLSFLIVFGIVTREARASSARASSKDTPLPQTHPNDTSHTPPPKSGDDDASGGQAAQIYRARHTGVTGVKYRPLPLL